MLIFGSMLAISDVFFDHFPAHKNKSFHSCCLMPQKVCLSKRHSLIFLLPNCFLTSHSNRVVFSPLSLAWNSIYIELPFMATSSTQTICSICVEKKPTYLCDGCSQRFCFSDLIKHRENLGRQFDRIGIEHDEFREVINDLRDNPVKHPLIKEIDQWEIISIDRIGQVANECRGNFFKYTKSFLSTLIRKLDQWTEQMKEIR